MNPIYLDCNATTPIDPQVIKVLRHHNEEEYGNAGSRTHQYGSVAKQAVQKARKQVARVVQASADEILFTSGTTESNNICILGFEQFGLESGKKHIITSAIEHKAVLEPCLTMRQKGFDVTVLPVDKAGWVDQGALKSALRPDTLLVSIMQANNETGIRQPVEEIAGVLKDHDAYFHTDAAQGFGKDIGTLRNPRIDMISISGHKIYGPKGIGALVLRRREFERPPLKPIIYGGGQEKGLRPGTLPVALIAALGKAAEIALEENDNRRKACLKFRKAALDGLATLGPKFTGDQDRVMEHVLNLSFPGLDSEAAMLLVKDVIAVSNGSACTSSSYQPSHVLKAMGMSDDQANACLRISWCHLTPEVDWDKVVNKLKIACDA